MFCSIYRITNIVNGKNYIGQTWKTLSQRFSEHTKRKNCIKLHNAIHKYGPSNFKIELILFAHTQQIADYWETFFIQKFDTIQNGYNITEGGSGSRGYKHTQEHKNYISKIMLGANNPMFGKPGSMLGRNMPESAKKALAEQKSGTNISDITKKKISDKISGENHPNAKLTKQNVKVIKQLLKLNIDYKSIAKQFNVTPNSIFLIKINKTWKDV